MSSKGGPVFTFSLPMAWLAPLPPVSYALTIRLWNKQAGP